MVEKYIVFEKYKKNYLLVFYEMKIEKNRRKNQSGNKIEENMYAPNILEMSNQIFPPYREK